MNQYNAGQPASNKAGFYGLDVYCLWESMTELMPYLQNAPDSIRSIAQDVSRCFQPFSSDPSDYAFAVANASANCRAQTEAICRAILHYTGGTTARDEAGFVMQQNALVALNGERYYRTSVTDNNESWNIRDRHMHQTLSRLLELHGPDSKAIVWEHNTHVGDARYTDMVDQGVVNVGQLARESFGAGNVFIVGFGSYGGSVIAASGWGAQMQEMPVPNAQPGSWEALLHNQDAANKIILSRELKAANLMKDRIGHRAIGVVYDPNRERGNYVPSVIPQRYDAFLFFDRTRALRPIGTVPRSEPPDTYPSGF